MISAINKVIQKRLDIYGAPYRLFAIFGVLNYPLTYLYHINMQIYESLAFRLINTILCALLLFNQFWPQKLKSYFPLYWIITVTCCLPYMGTYLLIMNNFNNQWLINLAFGLFMMIIMLDWLLFISLLFIGAALGYFTFLLQGVEPYFDNTIDNIYQALYYYAMALSLGIIFVQNKNNFQFIQGEELHISKNKINVLEDVVKNKEEKLAEALNIKTEILNNINHEIRTPVHGFSVISEALVEHWEDFDNEKKKHLASQVANNANRLKSLINNLLDLSNLSNGRILLDYKKVNFSQMILDMIEECRSLYIEDKKLDFIYSNKKDIHIHVDEEKINQVLRNLYINAIKFSPEGSVIKISAEIKNNQLLFSISDAGVGIAIGELESIFNPFMQGSHTKSQAGGKGLGLAISKNIINAHHGRIWAENNKGKGAIFHFSIPIMTSKRVRDGIILMIDDEEICLNSMELILHDSGYKLIKAETAKAGLKILEEEKVDLLLLDLMLPDIHGLEFLKDLRSKGNEVYVIIQSGVSSVGGMPTDLGISGFIAKPYHKDTVLSLIDSVMQRP